MKGLGKDIYNFISRSALAGFLIALAGAIFLLTGNKWVGSAMFSCGLIGVILFGAHLYTGKIGYTDSWNSFLRNLIILVINLVVAFLVGLIFRYVVGTSVAMDTRLAKTWYRILLDGVGCGALIYFAVEAYKQTKSLIPVILGVMAFILAGFEHCIADAFYFGACELTWKGFGYLLLVVLGNSIGSLLVRFLQIGFKKKDEKN